MIPATPYIFIQSSWPYITFWCNGPNINPWGTPRLRGSTGPTLYYIVEMPLIYEIIPHGLPKIRRKSSWYGNFIICSHCTELKEYLTSNLMIGQYFFHTALSSYVNNCFLCQTSHLRDNGKQPTVDNAFYPHSHVGDYLVGRISLYVTQKGKRRVTWVWIPKTFHMRVCYNELGERFSLDLRKPK